MANKHSGPRQGQDEGKVESWEGGAFAHAYIMLIAFWHEWEGLK